MMKSLVGTLQSAANNIVSINRSSTGMNRTQSSYSQFLRFMEVEANSLQSIQIDKKKLNKALSANVSTTFGNTGNLLGGLLNGALDIGGFLSNFVGGGKGAKGSKPPVPKARAGKVRLPGVRGLAILTPLLAGLDFAEGISEGESASKAAAGAAGGAAGAAGGALAGAALAGAIGQVLVPVPGLGFVLGAAVGSLGAFAGGYLADRAYEAATGEGKGGKEGITQRLREEEKKQKTKAASLGQLTLPQVLDKFESVVINFKRTANNLADSQYQEETSDWETGETKKDKIDYRPEDAEEFLPGTPTGEGDEIFPLVGGRPNFTMGAGLFNASRGKRRHSAQDIGVDPNTQVVASRSGKVLQSYSSGYGDVGGAVVIRYDNGQQGLYGHVNPSVKVGDNVKAGQKIARVSPDGGNTHLHYMRRDTKGNYIDPLSILKKSKSGVPIVQGQKEESKQQLQKQSKFDSSEADMSPKDSQTKSVRKSEQTKDLSKMSTDQLKGMLDPTKTGASNPAVFQAATKAREDSKMRGLVGEDLERQVLIASIKASQNTPMVNVVPSVQQSIPQQIQQYPSYNQPQSSMTIVPMIQSQQGQQQSPMIISTPGGQQTVVLPGPSESQVLNSLLKSMLLTNLSST